MKSIMIVPLLLEGEGIGVITFVATESSRQYTKNDLAMAEEVASRMTLAIENARLYTDAKTADEVQRKLAAIVESSDDAIISKSVKGIITSWNKGAERLYKYKAYEVIGKPVSILMPKGRKSDFPWMMQQLQLGGKVEHYETKRQTKDGDILDVSITVSPIKDASGKIIGASKVARDITTQKRAEEQQRFLDRVSVLLSTTIDYESTLKSLGKIIVPYMADYCRIVVLDEKQEIKEITVNHKDRKKIPLVRRLYAAYKGQSRAGVGKILSSGKSEYFHKITPEIKKDSNAETIQLITELHLQSYMGIPMKIGKRVIGALTFSSTKKDRLYTKDDVALGEELARRAALAIENARLYAASQKAVTIRDEFISIASHELKTPVTSLKMYVQVTKKQIEAKGGDGKNLEKMDNQVDKLTHLIQDLLNVSRFQAGMLDYNDDLFDLDALVDEVVDNIQPTTPKHLIKIDGILKKKVWGDKDRIGQVITNLLTNAVKYSPNADKVLITLTPELNFATVTVQDFGIGIDKQHLNKLFERFYRVNDMEEKTFPGLGLGLYISNEIIKRYGGKMKVVSQKGKGSQFSFTLPYTPQTA